MGSRAQPSELVSGLYASRLARSLVPPDVLDPRACLGFLQNAAKLFQTHVPELAQTPPPSGAVFRECVASIMSFVMSQVSWVHSAAAAAGEMTTSPQQQQSLFEFRAGHRASVTMDTFLKRCLAHSQARPRSLCLRLRLSTDSPRRVRSR